MNAVKDSLNRLIRVTDERIQHINENHPELAVADLEEKIINTLQYPEIIVASISDETVELYYKRFFQTRVGNKWLCVVVKNLIADFFVITLYYTDTVKKGREIWKKT